ncbi:hypothetical protein [Mycolicibacterium litorale]|nr:hypothetical protein [Mycolicibacterium litorale]TDY06945.1 hypothetical protein BCL50_3286 [Mycolicibacterium litorale]
MPAPRWLARADRTDMPRFPPVRYLLALTRVWEFLYLRIAA